MPAPKTAARLTAKQRACAHPPQHVHPCYDDRWETCDLCHLIRPRPLPAPWIVEWDESQPAEPVPALFAEPQPAPAPAPAPPARAKKPATATAAIVREPRDPETFGDLLRAARRDRALLGSPLPWQSPPLDEVYTTDQITTCRRCRGLGTIEDQRVPDQLIITYTDPYNHDTHAIYSTARSAVAEQPRTCPRCQGAGRIPKYTA